MSAPNISSMQLPREIQLDVEVTAVLQTYLLPMEQWEVFPLRTACASTRRHQCSIIRPVFTDFPESDWVSELLITCKIITLDLGAVTSLNSLLSSDISLPPASEGNTLPWTLILPGALMEGNIMCLLPSEEQTVAVIWKNFELLRDVFCCWQWVLLILCCSPRLNPFQHAIPWLTFLLADLFLFNIVLLKQKNSTLII